MIAYDLDRGIRDPRDLEDLIDAKVLYGVQIRSVNGSLMLENDVDFAVDNKSSAVTARRVTLVALQAATLGPLALARREDLIRVSDQEVEPDPGA